MSHVSSLLLQLIFLIPLSTSTPTARPAPAHVTTSHAKQCITLIVPSHRTSCVPLCATRWVQPRPPGARAALARRAGRRCNAALRSGGGGKRQRPSASLERISFLFRSPELSSARCHLDASFRGTAPGAAYLVRVGLRLRVRARARVRVSGVPGSRPSRRRHQCPLSSRRAPLDRDRVRVGGLGLG